MDFHGVGVHMHDVILQSLHCSATDDTILIVCVQRDVLMERACTCILYNGLLYSLFEQARGYNCHISLAINSVACLDLAQFPGPFCMGTRQTLHTFCFTETRKSSLEDVGGVREIPYEAMLHIHDEVMAESNATAVILEKLHSPLK